MPEHSRKVRMGECAGRQWGRVKRSQLKGLGLSDATIGDWVHQGYLHPRLPGVYAVGHAAASTEAAFAEALLYAGPGAMLSHQTAAWWLGLLDDEPRQTHVSTPHERDPQSGIVIHERRKCARIWHRHLPTTTVPQTFLDLAATEPLRTVRRALARADYAGILDVGAVEAALGRGRRGSKKLRAALDEHRPALAHTKSRLEVTFFELCEQAGLPLPEVNASVSGWEVDALWHEQRIAVELDGYRNHRSPAQIKRDRRKELALRTAGYTPVRYSEDQLTHHRNEVLKDLRTMGLG